MNKVIESIVERLDNSKITFGLREEQIAYIEDELKRFSNGEINGKYVKYIWEKLGKELYWEPFTLALYYFEYLDKKELLNNFKIN